MEINMTDEKKIEELTYEQAFTELQTVISALEAGDKPLEEALALYERGQALYQYCTKLLDNADLKVQQLNEDGELEDFGG
jgi:exodeoxyribonuclease VII small subunit